MDEMTTGEGARPGGRSVRIAASTLLAAALLSGVGSAGAVAAEASSTGQEARVAGVTDELSRAVARGEISEAQAEAFLGQVLSRLGVP